MADEPVLDLDNIGDATDDKVLQAALEKIKQQEQPPAPPEGAEGDLVEAKPEEKPAEEVKAETKQPEPDPDKEIREGALRRKLRELEQQLTQERMRNQQPPPVETKKPLTFDDDPAEYLRSRTETTEQRLARLEAETQQQRYMDGIRSQEATFAIEHPDYQKAVSHLIQSEVKEWERTGLAQSQVRQLTGAVEAARAGNNQFAGVLQHVNQVAQRSDVQEYANANGRTVEDVALWMTARDSYLSRRQMELHQGAEALGRSIPAHAYELAKERGYAAQQQEAQQTQNEEAARQARERVLHAKEISNAANSLSEMGAEQAGPQPRIVRNRAQILNLDEASLDEMIANGSYRNL